MSKLKWMNWNEWIETNELKCRNWNEEITMNWSERLETNELSWRIEMNELTWMNWNEWLETNDLKRMNWNEAIDSNELNWMNEITDLTRMNWHEKVEKTTSFVLRFCVINYLMVMWLTYEIELSLQSRAHFVGLIFQKWSEAVSFLTISTWNRALAPCSLVRILSTLSSKSGKNVSFWRFWCDQLLDDDVVDRWDEALATVAHILCRPHLQKVVRSCQFFDDFYVKSSSRCSLVHILSTTFGIEPRNRGNRHPPAATKESHFTRKNTGFCAQESFQPGIHAFRLARTSQLLDDDVIGMIMWLTWWCDS